MQSEATKSEMNEYVVPKMFEVKINYQSLKLSQWQKGMWAHWVGVINRAITGANMQKIALARLSSSLDTSG